MCSWCDHLPARHRAASRGDAQAVGSAESSEQTGQTRHVAADAVGCAATGAANAAVFDQTDGHRRERHAKSCVFSGTGRVARAGRVLADGACESAGRHSTVRLLGLARVHHRHTNRAALGVARHALTYAVDRHLERACTGLAACVVCAGDGARRADAGRLQTALQLDLPFSAALVVDQTAGHQRNQQYRRPIEPSFRSRAHAHAPNAIV